MTASKYIVAYASPKRLEGLIEVESLTPDCVRRDARTKLRAKYGKDAAYCTIIRVTLKRAMLSS